MCERVKARGASLLVKAFLPKLNIKNLFLTAIQGPRGSTTEADLFREAAARAPRPTAPQVEPHSIATQWGRGTARIAQRIAATFTPAARVRPRPSFWSGATSIGPRPPSGPPPFSAWPLDGPTAPRSPTPAPGRRQSRWLPRPRGPRGPFVPPRPRPAPMSAAGPLVVEPPPTTARRRYGNSIAPEFLEAWDRILARVLRSNAAAVDVPRESRPPPIDIGIFGAV